MPRYPFIVKKKYNKTDIYKICNVPENLQKGNWNTGYTRYKGDWFIFCNVGMPGRTGHDYKNRFIDDDVNKDLIWYGKNGSHLGQKSIRSMLEPGTLTYIFYRSDNRDAFTFAGIGKAKNPQPTVPVQITWTFRGAYEVGLESTIWESFGVKNPTSVGLRKPQKKANRKVNIEDLQANRDAIGKASEEFALEWEKKRLIGLDHSDLVPNIIDRRDTPAYGYDFESFNAPGSPRYIEVKSLGFDRRENCYRFFLSENERQTSNSDSHGNNYYFYMVLYGKDSKPMQVVAKIKDEIYENSDISPCAYIVRFELDARDA